LQVKLRGLAQAILGSGKITRLQRLASALAQFGYLRIGGRKILNLGQCRLKALPYLLQSLPELFGPDRNVVDQFEESVDGRLLDAKLAANALQKFFRNAVTNDDVAAG
jgi:hypothetical protein